MNIQVLEQLIRMVAKLPGLGPRSARRIVLYLISNVDRAMLPLAEGLKEAAQLISACDECGNIDLHSPCSVCSDEARNNGMLCVVEGVSDLWAIEKSGVFSGRYHILGGNLSALEGRMPEHLSIEALKKRVMDQQIKEVVIATNYTIEGQTTGYYISDLLKPLGVRTTRLAHGIPVGGELEYMDDGTLVLAMKMRQEL
ncbi:MAG: recombination protein RecR [Proteobacteria bacterium]|nr:recombination protein RecR [Pseudomonadota bacterium]